MVVSKLDSTINYIEHRNIDDKANDADKGLDANMYITDYLDVFVIIALGNQRFTYIDKKIIYVPIYLIKDDEIKDQIGVYEFVGSQLYNLLDDKDEFNLELLGKPLLYSFVTEDFLEKYKAPKEYLMGSDEEEEEEEGEESESDFDDGDASEIDSVATDAESVVSETDGAAAEGAAEGDAAEGAAAEGAAEGAAASSGDKKSGTEGVEGAAEGIPREKTIIEELFDEEPTKTEIKLQTKLEHLKEQSEFNTERETKKRGTRKRDTKKRGTRKKTPKSYTWIQKYMKNKNYTIINNEGGGDCLFAVVRDAFKSIGKNVTVNDLRHLLITDTSIEQTYKEYKDLYEPFNTAYITTLKQIRDLQKENSAIKKQIQRNTQNTKKWLTKTPSGIDITESSTLKIKSLPNKLSDTTIIVDRSTLSAPKRLGREEQLNLVEKAKENYELIKRLKG